MTTIVITTGVAGLILCAGLGAWFIAESVRKKTEKAIAVFYRDQPLEGTMMLNRISLVETRKEIENQKHKMEHGF